MLFPRDVNVKFMGSKERISLKVFTTVALIESLCSIPMIESLCSVPILPPRRLDLGWWISL